MIFQLILVSIQIICGLAVCWSAWALVCNSATHKDIMTFLEYARQRPVTGLALMDAMRKVSYRQHLRARMFWRDPWALYDPIVREAMENPRAERLVGLEIVPVEAEHREDAETKH